MRAFVEESHFANHLKWSFPPRRKLQLSSRSVIGQVCHVLKWHLYMFTIQKITGRDSYLNIIPSSRILRYLILLFQPLLKKIERNLILRSQQTQIWPSSIILVDWVNREFPKQKRFMDKNNEQLIEQKPIGYAGAMLPGYALAPVWIQTPDVWTPAASTTRACIAWLVYWLEAKIGFLCIRVTCSTYTTVEPYFS